MRLPGTQLALAINRCIAVTLPDVGGGIRQVACHLKVWPRFVRGEPVNFEPLSRGN